MLKKLISFFKRESVTAWIWWTMQGVSFYFYTAALIDLNKPEYMPVAGGIATILSYLFFTRKKGHFDSAIDECRLRLNDVMVMQDISNYDNLSHNLEGEIAKRDIELDKNRKLIFKLEDEIKAIKSPTRQTSSMSMFSLSSMSSSSGRRSTGISPRLPIGYSKRRSGDKNYLENVRRFSSAIRRNQRMSARLAFMEGVAILYSVFLSAFGSEFVKWWHSSCHEPYSRWLSYLISNHAC